MFFLLIKSQGLEEHSALRWSQAASVGQTSLYPPYGLSTIARAMPMRFRCMTVGSPSPDGYLSFFSQIYFQENTEVQVL